MSDTDARNPVEGDGESFDAESRRLCPDDNCTGVVGPDGRCKVCGKESADGPAPAEAQEPEEEEPAAAEPDPPAPAAAHEGDADDFDPEERVLCPDDCCTGLIGPDGKCKVCGKESPDRPPAAKGSGPKPAVKVEEKKPPKPLPSGKGEAKSFDPDDRILCSDDCCTGLVGPDGKCKVCGKPYAG